MSCRTVRPLALFAALVLAACSNDPAGPGKAPTKITALPRALTVPEQAVIAASNTFSSSLLRAVNSTRTVDSNVFISPLSATMALGMAMNGAGGTTFTEMRATLGFGTMTRTELLTSYRDLIAMLRGLDPRVDFRIANSVWVGQRFAPSVNPPFLADARDYFGARVATVDFAAPATLATINAWVKDGTNGKIDKILNQVDPDLIMLLVNAIYFKGDWRDAFDKAATRTEPFTTARGAVVQLPMMHRTGNAKVGGTGGRTVVESGYGGDAFAMTVLLPAAGESVDDLVRTLTPDEWNAQVATLRDAQVDLSFPRFKLDWEGELNRELSAMGMPSAFIPGKSDFTQLSSTMGREIFISFVKQKTYVDVNELGTEAAAVTGIGFESTSVPQRVTVRVDRPFVFAIRERLSGTILFIGKIVNPAA